MRLALFLLICYYILFTSSKRRTNELRHNACVLKALNHNLTSLRIMIFLLSRTRLLESESTFAETGSHLLDITPLNSCALHASSFQERPKLSLSPSQIRMAVTSERIEPLILQEHPQARVREPFLTAVVFEHNQDKTETLPLLHQYDMVSFASHAECLHIGKCNIEKKEGTWLVCQRYICNIQSQ